MAIAHVQTPANGVSGTSPQSLAFGSNVVAGNLLVADSGVSATGRTITITDNNGGGAGNTYTNQVTATDATDGAVCVISSTLSATASAACTVTSTVSGAAATVRLSISEYAWNGSTGSVDQTAAADTGSTSTPSAGTKTPSVDGCLLHVAVRTSNATTISAGTDFTMRSHVPTGGFERLGAEDYIQPTAASHALNFTISGNNPMTCCAAAVIIKPAGSSPATNGFFPGFFQ